MLTELEDLKAKHVFPSRRIQSTTIVFNFYVHMFVDYKVQNMLSDKFQACLLSNYYHNMFAFQ